MVNTKTKGTIAVIMSVYHGDTRDNLKAAIDSIVNQSFTGWHLYICCDGPLSIPMLRLIIAYRKTNNRIYVDRLNSNSGLANALNHLLDSINFDNYEYIIRMDADDLCLPNRLEAQLDFMKKHDFCDVSGSFCYEFVETDAQIDRDVDSDKGMKRVSLPTTFEAIKRKFAYVCPIVHPTVIFRSKIFQTGFRYPTKYSKLEDLSMWYELIDNNYVIMNCDQYLLRFRTLGTSKRRAGFQKSWHELLMRWKYVCKYYNYHRIDMFFMIILKFSLRQLSGFGFQGLYNWLRALSYKSYAHK